MTGATCPRYSHSLTMGSHQLSFCGFPPLAYETVELQQLLWQLLRAEHFALY